MLLRSSRAALIGSTAAAVLVGIARLRLATSRVHASGSADAATIAPAERDAIADALVAAREDAKRRLDALPAAGEAHMHTQADAYAVQDAVIERMLRRGHKLAGWKIGATAAAAQQRMHIDAPFAGPMFAAHVLQSPARIAVRDTSMRVPEPEFAFVMAADLAPRAAPYTPAEVARAVARVAGAIEFVDRRVPMPGAPERLVLYAIADAGFAHRFVPHARLSLGAEHATRLAERAAELHVNGALVDRATGAAVLGDPLLALTWLANHLSRRAITLRAGDWVSSGLITKVHVASPGESVVADFGADLGSVQVDVVAEAD